MICRVKTKYFCNLLECALILLELNQPIRFPQVLRDQFNFFIQCEVLSVRPCLRDGIGSLLHGADAVQHRSPLVIIGVGLEYTFCFDQCLVVPAGKKMFIGDPEMSVHAFFCKGCNDGSLGSFFFLFLEGAYSFLKRTPLVVSRVDLKDIVDFQ